MVLKEIIVWSIIAEAFILLCRLHFGSLQKWYRYHRKATAFHHGYLGLVALILFYFIFQELTWLLIFGLVMIISDLVHHLVVLPLMAGRAEIKPLLFRD